MTVRRVNAPVINYVHTRVFLSFAYEYYNIIRFKQPFTHRETRLLFKINRITLHVTLKMAV